MRDGLGTDVRYVFNIQLLSLAFRLGLEREIIGPASTPVWVLSLNLDDGGCELTGEGLVHAVGGSEFLFCLKMSSRVRDDYFAHVVADPDLGYGLGECFNRSCALAVEGGGGDPRTTPVRFGSQQFARNGEVPLMVFECFQNET